MNFSPSPPHALRAHAAPHLLSPALLAGIEVAKNVVLAGVRSFTIHDTKDTTVADLGTQFFLTPEDIGGNRAEASAARLAELNPYVCVESSAVATLSEEYIRQFQCVVLTECSLEEQVRVDGICRAQTPPIQFICADVYGLFGAVFVDFGPGFQVVDATGEEPKSFLISQVTQEETGVVTTIDMRMHNLEDGDKVRFAEVEGMSELNEGTHTVKVLSPYKFSIGDTRSFEAYTRNGSACQVRWLGGIVGGSFPLMRARRTLAERLGGWLFGTLTGAWTE